MTKVTLAAIALVSSVVLFAGPGEQAAYVDGTARVIPLNARGTLDLQDQTALQFHYGKSTYKVPYENITAMEFKDKANLRFGVKTAVKAVPHLFSRSKNQYLNVSFKGDQGRATELVFELSPESVGKVTPTLEARTGKKLHADAPVVAAAPASPASPASPSADGWWGDSYWKTTRNADTWAKKSPASE